MGGNFEPTTYRPQVSFLRNAQAQRRSDSARSLQSNHELVSRGIQATQPLYQQQFIHQQLTPAAQQQHQVYQPTPHQLIQQIPQQQPIIYHNQLTPQTIFTNNNQKAHVQSEVKYQQPQVQHFQRYQQVLPQNQYVQPPQQQYFTQSPHYTQQNHFTQPSQSHQLQPVNYVPIQPTQIYHQVPHNAQAAQQRSFQQQPYNFVQENQLRAQLDRQHNRFDLQPHQNQYLLG